MLTFNSYKTMLLLLIMFSPFSVAELKMPNEKSLIIVGYAGECDSYQEYEKLEYLPEDMISALQDERYLFMIQKAHKSILFCSVAAKNKFEKLGNKLLGEELIEFLIFQSTDLFYERNLVQSKISRNESRSLYFKAQVEFGRCINRCFVNGNTTSACLSSLTSCSERNFGKETAHDFFHTNKIESNSMLYGYSWLPLHPAILKLVNYKMTVEFITSDYFFNELKFGYLPTKNWLAVNKGSLNSEYLFEYYLALFTRAMKSRKVITLSPANGVDKLYVKLNLSQKNELLSSISAWLFAINQGSTDINKHCQKNNQESKVNMSNIRVPHNIQAWMLREKRKLDGHDTVAEDIKMLKFIENCNLDGRAINLDMVTDAIDRDRGIESDIFVMYKWSVPNSAGVRTVIMAPEKID